MTSEARWIDVANLSKRLCVSRNTVWRWVREDRFPAPVRLSGGCTRWRLDDIERWEQVQCAHAAEFEYGEAR